jgi:hypothetical protein
MSSRTDLDGLEKRKYFAHGGNRMTIFSELGTKFY